MSSTASDLLPFEHWCYDCVPPCRTAGAAHLAGHRRWAHPTALEALGEECSPPPLSGLSRQWAQRLADLDQRPGVWRRWPYGGRSAAYRAARSVADRATELNPGGYRFGVHRVDDRWWVYGVLLQRVEP